MEFATCLALFAPLAGFLGMMIASHQLNRPVTCFTACLTVFTSFLCFTYLCFVYNHPLDFTLFHWIPLEQMRADFSIYLDSLSLLMALIITGVGFLIHIYSIGYMEHEEGFVRYFACLNFFVFAMLLLVLAGDLAVLLVGWEGVGLASYLLIGYWYHRPKAAQAATKAFVMNRIGDLGLLLGLLLTFQVIGTSNIGEIFQKASQLPNREYLLTLLTGLYFISAIGKSAQLPLHTWLPDAMEGPTPVSALIHAATMVTAGVYLVVRFHPVFILAPETLQAIGIIGAVTALFAALCATGQTDLKRVLAYSTISQLGLMFLACGVGAFYAAMFHLTTHAFIKALLFLSAGNVVHMMHGVTEMEKMGGLARKFPKTHWLFLIGVLALSGIPPLAAFFSKDLILEQTYSHGFKLLFYIGLVASLLTAFYLMRAYSLTFMGTPRLENSILKMIHEAPRVMLSPVAILAFFSIVGGFLGFAFGKTPILEILLAKAGLSLEKESSNSVPMLLSIAGALLGVSSAAFYYIKHTDKMDHPFPLLKQSFYVDELYEKIIVNPSVGFAKFLAFFVEPKIFDNMIKKAASLAEKSAYKLQVMQSGYIRSYVAWMVIGAVFLIFYMAI